MLEVVSSEKLEQWISSAYSCACNHVFHDMELSRKHFLMLVLSELGEVVEADRKGKCADMRKFDMEYKEYENTVQEEISFRCAFEFHVKDSVEDELADVCIRLFDYCGVFGIELCDVIFDDELRASWDELFGEQSLCENCYELCSLVCDIDEGDEDDGIGCVLGFIFCMCEKLGIDLERHIELKMRYNELRSRKHGKKY